MDHDRWWASRPGALRNTVQRKAKKGIVDIQLLTTFDPGSWAAYEQIYAASWKPEEGDPALLRTFAEMFDIEFVHIGADTDIARLKQELRWNESAYR